MGLPASSREAVSARQRADYCRLTGARSTLCRRARARDARAAGSEAARSSSTSLVLSRSGRTSDRWPSAALGPARSWRCCSSMRTAPWPPSSSPISCGQTSRPTAPRPISRSGSPSCGGRFVQSESRSGCKRSRPATSFGSRQKSLTCCGLSSSFPRGAIRSPVETRSWLCGSSISRSRCGEARR